MSISDGLDPYNFCQKMEKTRCMKERMDGKLFIFRQSRHFSFKDNIIKVLFPMCTLKWRVNKYFLRQGKSINRRNQSTTMLREIVAFWYSFLQLEVASGKAFHNVSPICRHFMINLQAIESSVDASLEYELEK